MAKRRLKLDTPSNIRKALERIANLVYREEIDPKTANSFVATCNVILSGIRIDEQQRKIEEMEEVIARLDSD